MSLRQLSDTRVYEPQLRARLGTNDRRALVVHTVRDGMDWQHFSTPAALACPAKCLWVLLLLYYSRA